MEDKIIVYSTYYNPIEANIVKARLEDSDISCFLSDENVATIQPLYNQAIGGVKLNVFEKDVPRIDALLQEEINFEVDNTVEIANDEKVVCKKCGSTNVSYGQATKNRFSLWTTIVSLLLFVYPFKAKQCYHCYECGHEFE
jgi:DNA-directed RNA polymerase subunit M/transcription elongation factor TFIIS